MKRLKEFFFAFYAKNGLTVTTAELAEYMFQRD